MLRTLTSGRGVCVRGSGSDDQAARSRCLSTGSSGAQGAVGGTGIAGSADAAGSAGIAGAELAAAKASMRADILSARRAMDPAERAETGRAIRDSLLGLPDLQMAGAVAAYFSVATEPDTRGLAFAVWRRRTCVRLARRGPDGD